MKRFFYVSMMRDKRIAYLAGPFDDHATAIAQVDPARRKACEVDPWACFDAFGTCSSEIQHRGVLNDRLGLREVRRA